MNPTEELIARIMNFLAEKYKNQLILKGGMLLRLLNSPRATQDIDYSWIRTKKRSTLGEEIKKNLEQLEGVKVTGVQANSRGIFLDVLDERSGGQAKIEINVEKSPRRPPQPMTTAPISIPYSLKPQVITTMNLSEALSNKIAASLERDLTRDLYDLTQLEPLAPFDEATLRDRLSRLEVQRAKPRKVRTEEAAKMLKDRGETLTEKKIKQELSGQLPPEYLVGLLNVIRASVGRIVQRLENL